MMLMKNSVADQKGRLTSILGGTGEYAALWLKQAGIEYGFFWYVTG